MLRISAGCLGLGMYADSAVQQMRHALAREKAGQQQVKHTMDTVKSNNLVSSFIDLFWFVKGECDSLPTSCPAFVVFEGPRSTNEKAICNK